MSEQLTVTRSELKHWQIRAKVAEKQRAELVKTIGNLLRIVSWHCAELHHEKRDQHDHSVPCPVEIRIRAVADAMLKERAK